MFVELMPLLAGRTVLITVAKVDDKTLPVNVIPHGKADDNPALSTPLTCTGPPGELHAELGKHLAGYVKIHQQTASTLAEAKAIQPSRVGSLRPCQPGFNQLRNEFLTAARRVATTKKPALGDVVEWASGGAFKYGDVGRMTHGSAAAQQCNSTSQRMNRLSQPQRHLQDLSRFMSLADPTRVPFRPMLSASSVGQAVIWMATTSFVS
jgi:PRTRC genetic system protein E